MKKNQLRGSLLLTLTSLIWGMAFTAQRVGMDYFGPYTFHGLRFLIGGTVLLPVIYIRRKMAGPQAPPIDMKSTALGGILCGLALGSAAIAQQLGIMVSTAGKAGFITALYIVIVPLLGIFARKIPSLKIVIAVALAVLGMYLLCSQEGFELTRGDLLLLLCSLLFSFQILLVEHFGRRIDPLMLSSIEFYVSGIMGIIGMLMLETFSWSSVKEGIVPLLYAGVLSSGVAYTLQAVAQRDLDSTLASLLMSLESVFALIGGWIILGERLSARELTGCIIMFAAIILSQLPDKARAPEKEPV